MSEKAEEHEKNNAPNEINEFTEQSESPDKKEQPNAQPGAAEEMDNPYPTNPEHMSTMPQPGEDYNFHHNSMGQKASATHGSFWPKGNRGQLSTGREYGMKKYARLSERWDDRFHVSGSINNKKSHTYYKQFFGKPTRSNERVILKPKKQVDPFIENETKSRFPRYSKVSASRDLDKEFGWVDNFAITYSKNNVRVHKTFKEYFDKPVTYGGHVTVATSKGVPDASIMSKISTVKPTATVHILEEDRSNKYALKRIVQKSVKYNGMIPFLRDHNEKYTLGKRALRKYKQSKHRTKSLAQKRQGKEMGWHDVGYPISMHNEKNHFCKKLKFDDL